MISNERPEHRHLSFNDMLCIIRLRDEFRNPVLRHAVSDRDNGREEFLETGEVYVFESNCFGEYKS